MKHAGTRIVAATLVIAAATIAAQESTEAKAPSSNEWIRALGQRSERGALSGHRETVRGDSGKWNDAARLQHLPPLQQKPSGKSLDDWADELAGKKVQTSSHDDNWLALRTQQLDDNDRVWVERIERKGNEFTVVLNHAVWRGKYFKNFTLYQVEAVNLGQLPPGSYKAKWIIQTLEFTQFENPGQPKDNWPKDDRPSSRKPVELTVAFTVTAAK